MVDLINKMFEKNDCKEMAKYIIRTKLPENPRADIRGDEYKKLFMVERKTDAIYMAFLLGMARGYRLRKTQEKRA